MAFPLGYNYLRLIEGKGGKDIILTEYSKVQFVLSFKGFSYLPQIMGPMVLIPLLGKNFNNYFSFGLVFVSVLTFFRLHGWAAQQFSSNPNLAFDDYSDISDQAIEGRELISQGTSYDLPFF